MRGDRQPGQRIRQVRRDGVDHTDAARLAGVQDATIPEVAPDGGSIDPTTTSKRRHEIPVQRINASLLVLQRFGRQRDERARLGFERTASDDRRSDTFGGKLLRAIKVNRKHPDAPDVRRRLSDQLTRLEKSALTDYIGCLKSSKLAQLRVALRIALDID